MSAHPRSRAIPTCGGGTTGRLGEPGRPPGYRGPTAWIDGLDAPSQCATESQFFEFGRDGTSETERTTPDPSRSGRLCGHTGLSPVAVTHTAPGTLAALLQVEVHRRGACRPARAREGGRRRRRRVRPRAVRYTNPVTGSDVLPTMRAELHRLPRPRPCSRPGPASISSSTAPASSPSVRCPGPFPEATCSRFPPGSRSRPDPRRTRQTRTLELSTSSGSPTRRLRGTPPQPHQDRQVRNRR